MLKLSCFEDTIEYEPLPDWCRLFELWIKEEALLSIDCDNSLINEKICLLLLTCEELSNELEYIWDLWIDKNDDLSCRLKVESLLPWDDTWRLKLSCMEHSIEQEALTDRYRVFELWIEVKSLFFFDCDDSLLDEEIFLLLLFCAEQTNELECIWDLWIDMNCEEDNFCWLTDDTLLSEDEICMLKLSGLEQSIENEVPPDEWRMFELWIEEEVSLSFDCKDSLISDEICLLLLTCEEQTNELECIWDLWFDNDGEDDLLSRLIVENLLSGDDIWRLKLSCVEQSVEQEALPDR